MKILKQIAYVILIAGGLNWGLFGLIEINIIDMAFASIPMFARIFYVFVGISAIYILVCRLRLCTCCNLDNDCECTIKISTNTNQTEDNKII